MDLALPASVAALLAGAPAVGFSGSRRPARASLAALGLAVAALPSGATVLVGDAAGVDRRVRALLPTARVFVAEQYTAWQLSSRSVACVQACAAAQGVWASFPAAPCPAGLRPSSSPSACFNGSGSGTWTSLALALGLGLPAIVFLPAATAHRLAGGWPPSALAGGLPSRPSSWRCSSYVKAARRDEHPATSLDQ